MKKKIILFIGILCILVGCLFLGNKTKESSNLTTIKVAEVTHSIFYAPWYVAIENGYFKEVGLDIDLILVSGSDKVAAAVLSNDVSIGLAGPESTIYVYKGEEEDYLQSFAGITKRDGQFIISRKNEDNFKLSDLYNKEILVGRTGGMPSLNFLNALKKENVDASKININTSIDFASLSGTFIGGTGDYVNLFEPTASKVVSNSYGYVVASIGTLSGEMPYTTFSARKSYINNNQEIIKKFRSALNKGLEYVKNHNEEEIAKVISNQFQDNTINELKMMIKRYKEYDCWYDTTTIKEVAFKNLEDLLIDNNLLDTYVPFEDLVSNE